jgi:hypothetical protein
MSSAEYERFYREKVNGADKLAGAIGLAGWQRNALVEILFFMSRMPEQGD